MRGISRQVLNTFNEKIEFVHIVELEEEALAIVRKWEEKFVKDHK